MTKNDAAASATLASSDAWLAGHLYHLTEDQEETFIEFKALCERNGYYKPASDGRPSHDDSTMLYVFHPLSIRCFRWANDWDSSSFCSRFLRARRFDIYGAWEQFKDTEDWRRENSIDDLYANIDVDSYETSRRMVRYSLPLM